MKSNIANSFNVKSSKEAREVFALIKIFANFRRTRFIVWVSFETILINSTTCWFFHANFATLSSLNIVSYNVLQSIWILYFNLRFAKVRFKSWFFSFCFFWIDLLLFFSFCSRFVLIVRTMSTISNFNSLNMIINRVDVKKLFNQITCRKFFDMFCCCNKSNITTWVFENFNSMIQ